MQLQAPDWDLLFWIKGMIPIIYLTYSPRSAKKVALHNKKQSIPKTGTAEEGYMDICSFKAPCLSKWQIIRRLNGRINPDTRVLDVKNDV